MRAGSNMRPTPKLPEWFIITQASQTAASGCLEVRARPSRASAHAGWFLGHDLSSAGRAGPLLLLHAFLSPHLSQAHVPLLLQAPATEASSNAGWWREHLGRDLSGPNAPQAPPLRSHPVSDPSPGGRTDADLQRATAAWNLGGVPHSLWHQHTDKRCFAASMSPENASESGRLGWTPREVAAGLSQ